MTCQWVGRKVQCYKCGIKEGEAHCRLKQQQLCCAEMGICEKC